MLGGQVSSALIFVFELLRIDSATRYFPAIQTVLEQLQQQNGEQINLINGIAADIRAESERQHNATIEQLKVTGQDLVSFNLTGVSILYFSHLPFTR